MAPVKIAFLVSTAFALLAASSSFSRPAMILPYEQMKLDADLVVVATPTAVRDTGAKTSFPGIQRDSEPVPAIRMEADFEIMAVLKLFQRPAFVRMYHQSSVAMNYRIKVSHCFDGD